MTVKIEEATRKRVAEFLPQAIEKAFISYFTFVNESPQNQFLSENDAKVNSRDKKFIDHHNACKVAIAHVQLLLKLAQWADVDVENDSQFKNSMQLALNETNKKEFLDLSDIGEES